jgi:hypothetical protein
MVTECFITLALFVVMLIAMLVGHRIGRHRVLSAPETSIEVIGTVDAAVFGLLGLFLAFAFSGASDRLVVRRAQIVQEANAIGTSYLRIDLLPASAQPPIRQLFRDYLESRIQVFDALPDVAVSNRALERSQTIQSEIWKRSIAACRAEPRTDACILLVPALNEMIDITTTRAMATRTHAPMIVMALLLLLAVVAAMLSGFAMSRQAEICVLHTIVFSLAISFSVYVVLDIEYPRAGLINLRSIDLVLQQLRSTMK